MKTREVIYKDESSLIVYITIEESQAVEVQEAIKEYEKKYDNVVVFKSGKSSLEDALKMIIENNLQ